MKQAISIALALIVIVVVGYVLLSERAAAPSEVNDAADAAATNDDERAEEPQQQSVETGTGTFADFFGSGQNVHCTFSGDYDEGVSGDGEFWYANDKMRVEATTRVDGEVYTSNMINDGERVYVWGGTAAGMQAMVMNADTAMNEQAAEDYAVDQQAAARVDMQQRVEYECNPWSVQETQFVPPSDIDFVDMQAMMDGYFQGEMRGMPEGMNF